MVNGLINTLVAFLMGGATISFNFTAADAAGKVVADSMSGTIITCGDSYRMETAQVIVVSDGVVVGIYQKDADEIILQNAQSGADIMANPFAMLKDGNSVNYDITAQGKDAVGLPEKVTLKAKNGAVYTIDIINCSALPNPGAATFVLDSNNYPTAIVTDLR